MKLEMLFLRKPKNTGTRGNKKLDMECHGFGLSNSII
jgi:hypothetical protein